MLHLTCPYTTPTRCILKYIIIHHSIPIELHSILIAKHSIIRFKDLSVDWYDILQSTNSIESSQFTLNWTIIASLQASADLSILYSVRTECRRCCARVSDVDASGKLDCYRQINMKYNHWSDQINVFISSDHWRVQQHACQSMLGLKPCI